MSRKEWAGVDTIHICAGVSALRPLMEVANSPRGNVYTSAEDIKHAREVAQNAITSNFTGPLLTAITFVRLQNAPIRVSFPWRLKLVLRFLNSNGLRPPRPSSSSPR
jgi:hypothetical protein